MSDKENLRENDILFQIDMQLYDEFNDKIAGMNDHLGDIYSLREVEEVEKAQKDREIELLRKAIVKQQKEIEELKKYEQYYEEMEEVNKIFIPVDKIKAKIEEQYDKKSKARLELIPLYRYAIAVLQSLIEKEQNND